MLAGFGLGCFIGLLLRRLTPTLVLATLAGLGSAIAYHVWLNADPARGDAMEGVGYVFALFCPVGGGIMAWGVKDLFR